MAISFRAASFNLENLFSRAKILNHEDHRETTRLLDLVKELSALLKKDAYTPADRAEILRLEKLLADYIVIRVDMGKLFTGTGANRRVTAAGKDDWAGVIDFKREKVSELARESTIRAIKAVKADVMAVVEAENRIILHEFNTQGLGTRKFAEVMCIDGNDQRGIDVGLLSNFPVTAIRPHLYDGTARSRTFSRDCPEMDLTLPDGRVLHVLVNHFISKMNGAPPPAATAASARPRPWPTSSAATIWKTTSSSSPATSMTPRTPPPSPRSSASATSTMSSSGNSAPT